MDRIDCRPDTVIVRLHDRPCVTTEDHERVKNLLWHAGSRAARLILDCQDVTSITATFLSALLVSMKRLGARPGDIVLCQVTPFVRSIFEVTRLDQIFPIVATCEEARTIEAPTAIPRIVEDNC